MYLVLFSDLSAVVMDTTAVQRGIGNVGNLGCIGRAGHLTRDASLHCSGCQGLVGGVLREYISLI